MSTIADHGYIPEEHAPDPLKHHGDPVPPGRLAIWMFLASEIMFFIGLLGTYIILRSGDPANFSDHGKVLNKVAAGINTVVLIFSSLTMALSVDAAQKGKRGKVITFLTITLLMAGTFMCIKYIEYKDKFTHYTLTATTAIEQTGPANAKMYAMLKNKSGDKVYTGKELEDFKAGDADTWKKAALPMKRHGDTFRIVPPLAGDTNIEIRAQAGAAPAETDPVVQQAAPVMTYLYDGHVHKEAENTAEETWKVHGMRKDIREFKKLDIHRFSPKSEATDTHVKSEHSQTAKHEEHEAEYEIPVDSINDRVWYGPQKNAFFSCYFALTGVHGLHVVGGMVPILFLIIFAIRRKILPAHIEYIGLYWHFVDLVWIFLFPLMYLI